VKKRLIISESEKNDILSQYGLNYNDEFIRPLQKLMECKFTTDGNYVIYEGKAYSTLTGNEVPINESWSLSDILHTGADILSAGMDFVIPGSGAVVDVLNALSYIIEAQFKPEKERDSLYIMAAITFGFVILPGPLQAIAVPLKRAVKTGVGLTSKVVLKGLKIIGSALDTILLGIPSKIKTALQSRLATNILGKYKGKITGFIDKFTSRIKTLLSKLTGKTGKKGVEKSVNVSSDQFKKMFDINRTLGKYGVKETPETINAALKNVNFTKDGIKVVNKTTHSQGQEAVELFLPNSVRMVFYKSRDYGWIPISGYQGKKAIPMNGLDIKYVKDLKTTLNTGGLNALSKLTGKKVGKNTVTTVVMQAAKNFFSKIPKISQGAKVLRKAGFAKGYTYKYMGPKGPLKGTISEITDSGVKILFEKNGRKFTTMVPVETFINKAVGAPWLRRGWGVTVPLFVKRFSDMLLPDGSNIDYNKLDSIPDLDPKQTSSETETFLQGEVAEYEGESNYTVNTNVQNIQNALLALGYQLPKAGADGKFGPETKTALEKFQKDNGLTTSVGKMNRLTTKKLAEKLKGKNLEPELQANLNKM
jgi:hypothetical protein